LAFSFLEPSSDCVMLPETQTLMTCKARKREREREIEKEEREGDEGQKAVLTSTKVRPPRRALARREYVLDGLTPGTEGRIEKKRRLRVLEMSEMMMFWSRNKPVIPRM